MHIEQLIKDCIKGNRRAQEELFFSYSKELMAAAYRYTFDKSAAQDVVQESFIKIFRSLNQLHSHREDVLKSWMYKITIRNALDWKAKHKAFYEKQHLVKAEIYSNENNLELQDALATLAELPEGYRQVFQLHVIDGYSHKEIGAMLNINESSSRSQLTRARALFNAKWQEKIAYEKLK